MLDTSEADLLKRAEATAEKVAERLVEKTLTKLNSTRKSDEDRITKLIAAAQPKEQSGRREEKKEKEKEKKVRFEDKEYPRYDKCERCGRRHAGDATTCWSIEHIDGTALAPNPTAARPTKRRREPPEAAGGGDAPPAEPSTSDV